MLSERGILLRPEANELRTAFAYHTQKDARTEQVQPRDQEVPNQRTGNFKRDGKNKNTRKGTRTKMTREYIQKHSDNGEKGKGKTLGQKEVEQMKGTREMSNEERKQSRKKQKREERPDDTHRNIT